MSFTFYTQDRAVKHFFQNSSQTPPAALWLALFLVEPPNYDGTGGTEVSATGYARQRIYFEGYNSLGSAGVVAEDGFTYHPTEYRNTNQITFSTTDTNFGGDVVAAGIYDAESGGNMLLWVTFGTLEDGFIAPVTYDTNKNKLAFDVGSIKTGLSSQLKKPADTSYFFYLKGEHFLKNNPQSTVTPKIAILKSDGTEFDFTGYARSTVTFGDGANAASGSFGNTTPIAFTAGETWDGFSYIYVVDNDETIDTNLSYENILVQARHASTINLNASSPTTFTITSGNLVLY